MRDLSNAFGDPIPGGHGFKLTRDKAGNSVASEVEPVAWFRQHEVTSLRFRPDFLSVDGDNVRLRADNGTWLWRLTGQRYIHHYGPGTTSLVLLEAKWPD